VVSFRPAYHIYWFYQLFNISGEKNCGALHCAIVSSFLSFHSCQNILFSTSFKHFQSTLWMLHGLKFFFLFLTQSLPSKSFPVHVSGFHHLTPAGKKSRYITQESIRLQSVAYEWFINQEMELIVVTAFHRIMRTSLLLIAIYTWFYSNALELAREQSSW
jgi:hypothetical protein